MLGLKDNHIISVYDELGGAGYQGKDKNTTLTCDGMHFNDEGAKVVAKMVYSKLVQTKHIKN
jgi:lysophospholipase L1-like esterase